MLEEKKLIELRKELIDNAVLVETMIEKSIKGLKEKNMALLESVINEDEPRANDYEIAIDEKCVSTIAQHQPATKPLRTILMILNISTTLERMADHLGIPRDRVYGVATPSIKAQIVEDLKSEYDRVVMVGDGINDLGALQAADCAILTEQQPGDRPAELYGTANFVIKHVDEVIAIVQDILSQKGPDPVQQGGDRGVSYKK